MREFGTSSLFVATNPISGLTSRMPVAIIGFLVVPHNGLYHVKVYHVWASNIWNWWK